MPSDNTYATILLTTIRYITISINFITLIIGTGSSICNLITFTAPQLRRNACVFYLLCASVFQLISILFVISTRVASDNFGSSLERQSTIFCKVRYYLVITLPDIATLYILLSILDRYFATCNSVRMRAWSQLHVAYRLSLGIFIFACITNIHLIIFFDIYNNVCQTLPNSLYGKFFAGYIIVFISLIPHISMLILCIFTFFNLKQTKQRVLPQGNTKGTVLMKRFESQLIVIIMTQAIVGNILLLLRIGSYSYSVLTSSNLNKTVVERAIESFAIQLGISLYYFNFAISFYVSTLTSKFFRNIFWKRINRLYHRFREQL